MKCIILQEHFKDKIFFNVERQNQLGRKEEQKEISEKIVYQWKTSPREPSGLFAPLCGLAIHALLHSCFSILSSYPLWLASFINFPSSFSPCHFEKGLCLSDSLPLVCQTKAADNHLSYRPSSELSILNVFSRHFLFLIWYEMHLNM